MGPGTALLLLVSEKEKGRVRTSWICLGRHAPGCAPSKVAFQACLRKPRPPPHTYHLGSPHTSGIQSSGASLQVSRAFRAHPLAPEPGGPQDHLGAIPLKGMLQSEPRPRKSPWSPLPISPKGQPQAVPGNHTSGAWRQLPSAVAL